MGNFLDTPITDKETEVDESKPLGLSYGLSAMQGWRAQMEDDHVQLLGLPDVRAASHMQHASGSYRLRLRALFALRSSLTVPTHHCERCSAIAHLIAWPCQRARAAMFRWCPPLSPRAMLLTRCASAHRLRACARSSRSYPIYPSLESMMGMGATQSPTTWRIISRALCLRRSS